MPQRSPSAPERSDQYVPLDTAPHRHGANPAIPNDPAELPIAMDHLLSIVRAEIERANTLGTTTGPTQDQQPPPSVPLPPPPSCCQGYVIRVSLHVDAL